MTPDNGTYDERAARIDLVCALRSAERLGLAEGVCNHCSLAVPGRPGQFLINPQGLHWSEVVPDDLVIVDAAGNHVAGKHAVEPTAFFIHGRIHRASPRAQCVLHTHMPHATALTIIEGGELAWASQNALRFYGRVAYERAYNGLALDAAEGDRMAASVRDADVLFLANHGVIVCGPSVAYAFDDLYYLERACELQVTALSCNMKLQYPPEEVVRHTNEELSPNTRRRGLLEWPALLRKLDRKDPSYAE